MPSLTNDPRFFDHLVEIAGRGALSEEEAASAMAMMADGVASHAQIKAFLLTPALSVEEVDADTLAGLVKVVRSRVTRLSGVTRSPLLDTCGTGGGAATFNISTAAALLVAASAGNHGVAKHGNRAVASRSGSADVLERMGVPIDLDADAAAREINAHGFAFLFAQKYHTAFAHVGPVRRELAAEGRRTAFNFIGPLANPALVSHQLIGIFRPEKLRVIAEVMARIGIEEGYCIAGLSESGEPVDEISLAGETKMFRLSGGVLTEETIHPGDAGIASAPLSELRAADAADSARIIRTILAGEDSKGPAARAVLLNAAACFRLLGETSWRVAAERAEETLRSGAASKLLDALSRKDRS